MIVVDARVHAKYLNFPNAYTLLLPGGMADRKRFPLVLCLHDLGMDRWQCMRQGNLEELAEKLEVALVFPDGRRSCFLNMAHGPRWNDYLLRELFVQLSHTFPIESGSAGVIGAGTGALGALALARQRIPCVLVEPEIRDIECRDCLRWPQESEWKGVFEGREGDWKPSYWQDIYGVAVGSGAAVNRTEKLLELFHWEKIYCNNGSGERWTVALKELAECMRKERKL